MEEVDDMLAETSPLTSYKWKPHRVEHSDDFLKEKSNVDHMENVSVDEQV